MRSNPQRRVGGTSPSIIEDGFPFEMVSEVAEIESWRKEVYRPIYHVHKWWAQRLGSVFRAAIIAAATPKGSSVMDLFYKPARLPGLVVFDPFMGSGTTVGEALKLGCTAIGRDINPVAHRSVCVALGPMDRADLDAQFKHIEVTAGKQIQELYRAIDSNGQPCVALYYFWVKFLPCPRCAEPVDLFSTYIFASHAAKVRHPEAKAVCPSCGAIADCRYDATAVVCRCGVKFDPRTGPARRTSAVCPCCAHEFPIAKTAAAAGRPPDHRMYAKLVLRGDGTKEYLRIDDHDRLAFQRAQERLAATSPPIPTVCMEEGHNTRQMLNYGYRRWHEMFNARQLLALATLAMSIRDLPPGSARDALSLLFSGVLEFNNMFVSYKGEGTGAVRHLFAHHILKPERMPIEANLWGTPKSSGAFSTLYRSRLLRALDYREAPFEVAVERGQRRPSGKKIFGVSDPMGTRVFSQYQEHHMKVGDVVLSCGDSAATDLPAKSVDLVVTDPPFFDNVHYSELADFFYAWQRLYFPTRETQHETTRRREEVQDTAAHAFSAKLQAVFTECARVLRDEGLLVFSYHHSKESGWIAVAEAALGAGFAIVQCHPVKAEMSVAAPKSQAKQPINLDVLMVCRKRAYDRRGERTASAALGAAAASGAERIRRFNAVGRRLSRNDVRVVVLSQLLVELSAGRCADRLRRELDSLLVSADQQIEAAWHKQIVEDRARGPSSSGSQRTLALEAAMPS